MGKASKIQSGRKVVGRLKKPIRLNGVPVPSQYAEVRFRCLVENMNEGVWLGDRHERTVYANPKFCQMTGYTLDEIMGRLSYDFWTKDSIKKVKEVNQKDRKKGISSSYEGNLLTKSGEIVPVYLSGSPLPDGGTIGVMTDLREVKKDIRKKEEVFKQSDQQYRMLLETAQEGILLTDKKENITYVNPKFADMIGYSIGELKKKSLWDLLASKKDRQALKRQTQYRKRGKKSKYDISLRHRDGSVRLFSLAAAPITDGSGKFIGSLGVYSDLTERVRTEQRYRTIFENTGTATIIIEDDMTISLANTEFEKISGFKKSAIENKKKWTEFFEKEDLKKMLRYHKLRRKNPKLAPRNYEVRFFGKDGRARDVYLTVAMIPGTKKSLASLLDISKRKDYEKALIASEEKFRSMIDQSMLGVCMLQKTKVVFANQKLADIFGYSGPQDMAGKDFGKFLNPPSYKKARKLSLARQKGAKIPELGEYIGVKKNGKHIHIQSFSKRIVIGDEVYSQVLVADVTEKKLMENKLAQRAKQFNVLYRIHSHIIMAHRFSRVLNRIAKDLIQLLQYPAAAYVRITFDDKCYYSSESRRRFARKIEQPLIVEGVRRGKMEVGYHKTLPGMKRDPFGAEERKIVKNVARALQRHVASREVIERFRKVVKRSVTAIYITENGILRYANPRFCKFFQCKEKDILGLPISSFITHSAIQERLYEKMSLSSIRHHSKGVKTDGTVMIFEAFAQRIEYQGRPAILGRLLNVTDLKEAEKHLKSFNEELKAMVAEKTRHLADANRRLQSLNDLKDEFIAVTSHELRSPLTSIRGYLSFLMDSEVLSALPDSSRKYLLRAYQNTESLNHLVNNILDVSRLDMGRFKLQKTSVSLTRLAKAIMDSLSYQAGENNLTLNFDNQADPQDLVLKVDSIRISQVLRNLLDNAIKFSRQGKEIVLRLKRNKRFAYIQVADQGVGIPKSKIVEIFDKFMQVRNSDTCYKGGAGLGLFIAKRIIELHGGNITVESEKNKGTLFTIKLPLHD